MWIRIGDQRIKDTYIREYKGRGISQSTERFCIEMKYRNTAKYFYFSTGEEYQETLRRLDETLKVQEI